MCAVSCQVALLFKLLFLQSSAYRAYLLCRMVHPLKASDWESAIRLATQVYETGLWASSGRTSSKVSDATVLASRMCTLQNRLTVAVDVPMAPKEWKKVFEDKVYLLSASLNSQEQLRPKTAVSPLGSP